MFNIVNLKDHPEVLRIIRFADPKYRKHKGIVAVAKEVELDGTYWDGGSRSSYTAVNMETGVCKTAQGYAPPQFGGPRQAPRVAIPEGLK